MRCEAAKDTTPPRRGYRGGHSMRAVEIGRSTPEASGLDRLCGNQRQQEFLKAFALQRCETFELHSHGVVHRDAQNAYMQSKGRSGGNLKRRLRESSDGKYARRLHEHPPEAHVQRGALELGVARLDPYVAGNLYPAKAALFVLDRVGGGANEAENVVTIDRFIEKKVGTRLEGA